MSLQHFNGACTIAKNGSLIPIAVKSFPVKPQMKRFSLLLDFITVQDSTKAVLNLSKAVAFFFHL